MATPGGLVDKQELIDAQLDTAHLGRVVNSKDASGNPIDTSTNRTGGVNKTLDALETEYLEAIQGAGGVSVGAWTAGVTTFNAYNEYAVYNDIPYKPRTSATLPYVAQGADPTVAPDDANVQPYQEITEAQVVAVVEATIPDYVLGPNLIPNSDFSLAGSVANAPDATPRSYSADDELFQGFKAAGALSGVTYVDGKLNGTGQLYVDVYKSEKGKISTAPHVASIASSDGVPVESGALFIDNGDYWRVTFDMNDTFSVKFEQGSVATRHDIGKLEENVVHVLDFGGAGIGGDDTQAFIRALNSAPGVKVVSSKGLTHQITGEILIPDGCSIDLNGATILDNVQGFWSVQPVRAAPLFFIYDTNGSSVKNFIYEALPSRNTVSSDIPTGIIAVGRQGTTNETTNFEVSGIKASNLVDFSIFVSVLGEAHDGEIKNIDISGDCTIGVNFEYGIAPSGEDTASAYGAHPYDIKVRNFRGFQNTTSRGFLRTAGTYNISFENCFGYNVASFIYAWTGDRGIQRTDQNVNFKNCKHYSTGSYVGSNVVTIVSTEFDGSTGDPLPSWTNRDIQLIFDGCQFEGNNNAGLAGIRYIGSQGKVQFNGCTISKNSEGVRCGGSSGISTTKSENTLEFNGCTFKGNDRDLRLVNVGKPSFNGCNFKDQTGIEIPVSIESVVSGAKFYQCNFSGMTTNQAYVETLSGSSGSIFENCSFDDVGGAPSLDLRTPARISNCDSSNLFNTSAGFIPPVDYDGEIEFTPSLIGSTGGSQDGTGSYTIRGGLVYFTFNITSSATGRPTGNLSVDGLPVNATSDTVVEVNIQRGVFSSGGYGYTGKILPLTNEILIQEEINDGLATQITDANLSPGVNSFITIKGVYSI